MNVFPTENEIRQALALLIDEYKVPDKILKALYEEDNLSKLNNLLDSLGEERFDNRGLARLFIMNRGARLFSGSSKAVRELREHLLKELKTKKINELVALYERNPVAKKNINSPSWMITPLAEKKWVDGKTWPRDFVKILGFPLIFSGISSSKSPSTEPVMDIEARKIVPPLVDFQKTLKERMLSVLKREEEKTRCVVTLPTGGGKTRVAVESFIEWMQVRFSEEKYLIWIAQNEELCEQAIACIADMWQEKEFPEPLRIYRYFAGTTVNNGDLIGGAVVASIQQLASRIKNSDPVVEEMLRNCGAMIIDEAHHAVAPSYDVLLTKAEELCGPDLFPICGLTATPGRNNDETMLLVDRFQAHLIQPEIPASERYSSNPLLYFMEKGYLAKPKHFVWRSEREYEVDADLLDETSGDFTSEFLKVLANDERRNHIIVEKLLMDIPTGAQTLVYACTVEHAKFLSYAMNAVGRKAAYISADTPKVSRRMYIDAFRKGQIEFLFNYGVLTTGFDAPKTEYIVICRPTSSKILYEQIVGRGLRGPEFGGTEKCTIIDFSDNLHQLGKPLAYARFSDFWKDVEELDAATV